MTYGQGLFADFCLFARAQIESNDIDPMYPLLRDFYDQEQLPEEERLWRTLLYLTWYHVGAAEQVWRIFPRPVRLQFTEALPTGTERRGHRGASGLRKAVEHVAEVLDRADEAGGSLTALFSRWTAPGEEGPERGWLHLRNEFEGVTGAGPWASYKLADLLKHTHGYPIAAPDIGVGGKGQSAGPIPGMVKLTGLDWKECASNVRAQRDLLARAIDAGVPFKGLDQLETALCDFNSLTEGRYYVGHDIDMNMEQLNGVASPKLWEARRVFPDVYRGELGGWKGVRKAYKSLYKTRRELVNV